MEERMSIFITHKVIFDRKPGIFDWSENLVFSGLLFVATMQLIYALMWKEVY